MKLKTPDISTVIIVNKSQNSTRTLQIKTKHINRIRHYAWSILSVLVVLVGAVFYLRAQNSKQEQEKQQLLAQIIKLKGVMPIVSTEIKEGSAQSYIQAIENKLKTINGYLKRRGLKGFATKGVGGDNNASAANLTDNEKYSLFDDYMKRLVTTVAYTPMGYPRVSVRLPRCLGTVAIPSIRPTRSFIPV
jgi:hypothetical protein